MDSEVCDLSGSVCRHPVYRANERRPKTSWRIPRITRTGVCRGNYSRNRYQISVGKGRKNGWIRVVWAKWLENRCFGMRSREVLGNTTFLLWENNNVPSDTRHCVNRLIRYNTYCKWTPFGFLQPTSPSPIELSTEVPSLERVIVISIASGTFRSNRP